MAWIENSVTKMLSDGGPDATYVGDGDWTGHYKKITLTVSTSGNYANWSISTYANSGTYISVYLVIAGTVLYNDYYESGIKNNGYYNSGSIWIGDASSVAIDFRILCSQDMHSSTSRFENETVKYQTPLTRTWWENVTANKPTITAGNKNNFSISASAGNAGINNEVKSTSLYYRIGDSGSYTKASSLSLPATSINCAVAADSQNIYAYTSVVGVHNKDTSTVAKATVKNYQPPSQPGKPVLKDSSKKNGRLTVKQNWTFDWTAATATNKSSPVKGYSIRIWRLPKGGSWISKDVSLAADKVSYTFNPITYGFVAGDLVQFEVAAYSNSGDGARLFSPKTGTREDYTIYTISDSYLVENAGVVNVKVANKWVEGQVWVKADNIWHEAETVNVKVGNSWVESQ